MKIRNSELGTTLLEYSLVVTTLSLAILTVSPSLQFGLASQLDQVSMAFDSSWQADAMAMSMQYTDFGEGGGTDSTISGACLAGFVRDPNTMDCISQNTALEAPAVPLDEVEVR